MARERSLARNQRIYRSLLLLYPRAFRQVYGADMVQVFGDRLREERATSGRRANIDVWFRTLLDLFKSAPLQRMERKMSREAAFGILFVLFLAFVVVAFTMGSRGPGVAVGLGALVATGIALGASGLLRSRNSGGNVPAGKLGLGEWWVVLAAVMGAVELVAGVGQLIREPSVDNAFALAVIGGAGILVIAGSWFRSRSRSTGDWMIVVGILPFLMLFWAIWPPVLGVLVMAMALIDSARKTEVGVQSA
jgi:hypothetical protein